MNFSHLALIVVIVIVVAAVASVPAVPASARRLPQPQLSAPPTPVLLILAPELVQDASQATPTGTVPFVRGGQGSAEKYQGLLKISMFGVKIKISTFGAN